MIIGENIKKARLDKKITQKDLAKIINKSERMVQKYEKGEVEPSFEILKLIADNLDKSIYDFFDNDIYLSADEEGNMKLKKHINLTSDLIFDLIKSIYTDLDRHYWLNNSDFDIIRDSTKKHIISLVDAFSIKNHDLFFSSTPSKSNNDVENSQ